MTIEEAIVAFVRATPEITDIIGVGNSCRFYPEMAPQDAVYPHGCYTVIDFPQEYHLAGPSQLAHPRIQIDWWGKGPTARKEVSQLAEATRKAKGGSPGGRNLDGFAGSMNGLNVQRCELVDREYTTEPPTNAGEHPYRRARLDFIIWFKEEV